MTCGRTSRSVLLSSVLALVMIGCGGESGDAGSNGPADPVSAMAPAAAPQAVATRTPAPPDLVGAWLLEDLGGRGVMDMLQTTIEFSADGGVSGTGGCNRFMGSYTFEDGRLQIGPLAGTKKMCPDSVMDQEDRFHRALGAVTGVSVDGPFLLIHFEGSEKPLKFTVMEIAVDS